MTHYTTSPHLSPNQPTQHPFWAKFVRDVGQRERVEGFGDPGSDATAKCALRGEEEVSDRPGSAMPGEVGQECVGIVDTQ